MGSRRGGNGGQRSGKTKPGNGTIRERQPIYDTFDRDEIIDGIEYHMKPFPKLSHQALLHSASFYAIERDMPAGRHYCVSSDGCAFRRKHVVQPDLIFICNDNSGIVVNERIVGALDLVAKILSPGSILGCRSLPCDRRSVRSE